MAIPPFPSQDLAKLVLGYLAEEQLMTAYDEFLQASPYLDALRNEYDRIFMTSLKSILAEYRAVKICVDTCKPFALRKKIFQCTNLLDVVKFLIAHVDLKKIQQEAPDKSSIEKQNVTITSKPSICELCQSLSLPNCVCKSRSIEVQKPDVNYSEGISLQNSVEATPLDELPGNYVTTRKKHVKLLEKDSTLVSSNVSSAQNSDYSAKQTFSSHISPEEYLARCENSPAVKSSETSASLNSTVKLADPVKASQNIEEFNNVLKSVVSRNKTLSSSESTSSQRVFNAGTFQDFTSGVTGGDKHSATYNVPDSSTSENLNVRAATRKDVYNDNIKGPPHQLMLQVSHSNDTISIKTSKPAKLPKLLPKTLENQIKILSDVKVETQMRKKHFPVNATSTPLNLQTILINGTPAFKHTPNAQTFTKDEIMAMPTLIVVPAAGSPQVPTSVHVSPIITPTAEAIPEANNNSPQVLGPLLIDVPDHTDATNKPVEGLPDISDPKPVISDLVKTVDVKTSTGTTASVPKDNVIATENNTPQVLPPMRKSSSTPRRTSHVRVLDFATPRRILHETINEVPVPTCDAPAEIVVSGSHSVVSIQTNESETLTQAVQSELVVVQQEKQNDTGSTKENETTIKPDKSKKNKDWDADLRALVANQQVPDIPHRKPKTKGTKKKKEKSVEQTPVAKESTAKRKSKKQSPRVKKSTCRKEEEEPEVEPILDVNKTSERVTCKPNIKIICSDKSKDAKEIKADTSGATNKSNEKVEEYVETPETERLSLQNVIGAKLNISDFLETPYKQALYDIQMETPKFLGPDLPDIPLSNVKITDIPTPRFLNTPKLAQATPSSYSSRPTDYSSGGSYYKPDDQDYMPIPELLTCPVTSSSKEEVSDEKIAEKDSEDKKSRPVRQCAKNVSYYRTTAAARNKDVDDNVDAHSSCSDSATSSFECKTKKETVAKTPRSRAQANRSKTKKDLSSSKKKKSLTDSLVKDKTKSFMKIKPKQTPKRDTPGRNRKQMNLSPYSKVTSNVQPRKRTTSKDKKLVNTVSLVVPALTKSRRKSSTPRKLQCTKQFNSESCRHVTPDNIPGTKMITNVESSNNSHDSETEQLKLRWSDEGSQDAKSKDSPVKPDKAESEDLKKIQQFIFSTAVKSGISGGTLQRDLMRRGFDSETAKIIERDLLDDASTRAETSKTRTMPMTVEIVENKKDDSSEKTAETSSSTTKELQIAQDESEDDEIEFSVHESHEESSNYFVFKHDDTKETAIAPPTKLKDNFTMEICIEDMTVRLKATSFNVVLDQDPLTVEEIDYSYKETERAVDSISGMDRLYTPLKDSYKSKCYEIFDSTLTSIDTPLKEPSPARNADVSVTDLVMQGVSGAKDKSEAKTRKRARSSSNESANSVKRTKPDADLLLKAANIQNIDIETVLTKLHGH